MMAVGEGEEGARGDDAASEREVSFDGGDVDGIDSAHLARAYGNRLAGEGVDDVLSIRY